MTKKSAKAQVSAALAEIEKIVNRRVTCNAFDGGDYYVDFDDGIKVRAAGNYFIPIATADVEVLPFQCSTVVFGNLHCQNARVYKPFVRLLEALAYLDHRRMVMTSWTPYQKHQAKAFRACGFKNIVRTFKNANSGNRVTIVYKKLGRAT